MSECEFCDGDGLYTVTDKYGLYRLKIICPGCGYAKRPPRVHMNTPKEPLVNETSPNEQQIQQDEPKTP